MVVALIVAAGRGHRLGGSLPKQYRRLAGMPVLRHSVLAFLRHLAVATVQAVIHPDDRELYDAALRGLDLPPPVPGGATRQESVWRGLEAIAAGGHAPGVVLIHDAARPLVLPATITAVLAALETAPAAIAALPVADTLKRGAGGVIVETVDRADLWRAQTPQGFDFAAILAAHRAARPAGPGEPELTDDARVAERAGIPVALVPGSEDNFKITTEQDLERAERLLRGRRTGGRAG
jgi:2-C-methyl-D-erythritol 4-phosphate cytidylyltransferase / 2-C-methyl-D-erythritol 2,4-cyclodiphosphate synthase